MENKTIETNRLILKPLTNIQLVKYLRNDKSLEEELDVIPDEREISPELKEALETTILPSVADPEKNYLFSTLWTIILKDSNRMVGDLCFAGEPNTEGEIEIGYGTYEAYRGKGFMTEAVSGIICWAKEQPGVSAIVASSDKTNLPSSSILLRNNFFKTGESDGLTHWRLTFLQ